MRITENQIYNSNIQKKYTTYNIASSGTTITYEPTIENSKIYIRFLPYGGIGQGGAPWSSLFPITDWDSSLSILFTVSYEPWYGDSYIITIDDNYPVVTAEIYEVTDLEEDLLDINKENINCKKDIKILQNEESYLFLSHDTIRSEGLINEKKALSKNNFKEESFLYEIFTDKYIKSGVTDGVSYGHDVRINKPYPIWNAQFEFRSFLFTPVISGVCTFNELAQGITFKKNKASINVSIVEETNAWLIHIDGDPGDVKVKVIPQPYVYEASYQSSSLESIYYQDEAISTSWEKELTYSKLTYDDSYLLKAKSLYTENDGSLKVNINKSQFESLNSDKLLATYFSVSSSKKLLSIDNDVNITGGMTLGGSLTIPSDQNIEIGEVNLNDLEDSNVVEDGYLYSYEGITFLFNEHWYNKEILVNSTSSYSTYLVLPSGSNQSPKIKTVTQYNSPIVDAKVKKLPIKINSITTS